MTFKSVQLDDIDAARHDSHYPPDAAPDPAAATSRHA